MNQGKRNQVKILIADDDADDRLLIRDALRESGFDPEIEFVENGEELLEHLRANASRPDLIFLDLNMPKKDGREALREIKSDPKFRGIPTLVFTTSKTEEDIHKTYDLGVNSFVTKPVSFESLVSVTREIGRYWFELVQLPHDHLTRKKAGLVNG